ncbi:MAG: GAF domain-containing protein [Halanaeroarchaeum sp.]
MTTTAPAAESVLETVTGIGPPGTPVTTSEVAEAYDCTQRTIYNRLDTLAEEGRLATKKVGARGRVWWRPPSARPDTDAGGDSVRTDPVFDSEMVGVIIWGEDLTIQDANDAFLEMAGLDHEEAIDTSWQALTPEEYYPASEAHIEELEQTGSGVPYEKQYYDADGTRWWGLFESRRLDDGRVVEFVIDITDRKHATQQLRTEAELDAYRVDLADAIRPLTDPGQIQHEAARLLGTRLDVDRAHYADVAEDDSTFHITADYFRSSVDSVVGNYHLDEFNPTLAEKFQAGETVVTPDVQAQPELGAAEQSTNKILDIGASIAVPIRKDGALTAFFAVTDSEPRQWTAAEVAMVKETADRTWEAVQRAAIETELRISETRLSKILAQLPVGVGVIDEDGDFELQNDRMDELIDTGSIPSADPDQRDTWTTTDEVGDERPPEEWPAARALDGEAVSKGMEFRYCGDAVTRWLDIAAIPFQGPGDGSKAIVVVQDITDRKVAQARIEASRADLASEVEAMRDLQALSTELIQEEAFEGLADTVLETAVTILDADHATIQLYDREREILNEIAHHGFDAETIVALSQRSDEGVAARALSTGDRVTVSDVEAATLMSGTDELETYRDAGIRAVQTTPLVARSGEVLGTLSTHWDRTHTLTDRDRQHLDVLARQAADLISHQQTLATLRSNEATLKRLNEASQVLLDLEASAFDDRVPHLVREVLDVESATLWGYDDDSGELERTATAGDGTPPDEALTSEWRERVWETFVGAEIHVAGVSDGPVDRRVLAPLGRHGVIGVDLRGADGFDDRTVEFVETVAATVETAWDRAASEKILARQNEELSSLDRLNTLIRQLDQALVTADSRSAIETAVCEQLADSERYTFAWIGAPDPGSEEVEVRAWAGVDSAYLEDLTVTLNDTGVDTDPIARAIATCDLQVVPDIATESEGVPWRASTLDRGARSVIAIPLCYEEATYGVLVVYGDQPQRDERTRAVLSELGDTIAHTINARETRATLQTDSVVELTVAIHEPDTPLGRLADGAGGTIECEGAVPRAAGARDVFFVGRDAPATAWQSAGASTLGVEGLHRLTDRSEGALFRARITEPTVASRCGDEGAIVRSLTVEATRSSVVIEVPDTTMVSSVLDRLAATGQTVELRARHPRERTVRSTQTYVAAVGDRLTDRQREVLQTAYLSGYFETPRASTGREVTTMLDISQPTFTEHLRGAERTLCEILFEETPPQMGGDAP